jgi:glycosyltransferase involved in cell wall biosynthesis
MKITFFQRKRINGYYSLENAFNSLRLVLSNSIQCDVFTSRFISKGIIRRFFNIIEAYFYQNEINHITGDVHFLSYFLKKEKTILTILDCVFIYNNKNNPLKKLIIYFFWYYIPTNRVKIIHVISFSTKNELIKYVKCDPLKIRVIPILISPIFYPTIKNFNSIKPRILQIGTGKNKNLLRVIQAIQGIPCLLDIVGILSDDQIYFLNKYNINYDNCFDIDEKNIFLKYQNCDIVIFASEYEGFGLPILEANKVGRPVITSNLYSMPEIAGNAAHIVNPFNIEEIRNGVLKLINDKQYRESLILNGFKNIRRFDQKDIKNDYINMYEEIIKP